MMKKGISPLIATVLIIGFTVALAAIIMTWGSGFIQGTQKDVADTTAMQLKCSQIDFDVECCSSTNTVKVENRYNEPLKFIIRNTDGATSTVGANAAVSTLEFGTGSCPGAGCGALITVFPQINIGDAVEDWVTCIEAGRDNSCSNC